MTALKLADSEEAESPAPEKELSAEEKHAKREQEGKRMETHAMMPIANVRSVKYCRHKLQRGLLTRDNVPSDDEVKVMSTYLKKLEDYPELEASIIRATKIHKVLKAMIKLQSIPRDEEYSFKSRAHELLAKWNKVLSDSPSAGDDKGDDKADEKPEDKADAPTTNGEAKSVEKDEAPVEPKVDADTAAIGTKVEGEKEAAKDVEKPLEPAADTKTDEPDISKAPAEEFKPPVETEEHTASS